MHSVLKLIHIPPIISLSLKKIQILQASQILSKVIFPFFL